MPGGMVVGVDGSEGSHRALAWATEAAAVRGAVVHAVTVCRSPGDGMAEDHYPFITSHRMDQPAHAQTEEAWEHLRDEVAKMAAAFPDVDIVAHVLDGDPAETLCRLVEGEDLLVVGARGRGTFATLLLGSVAAKCTDHSPRPVVIVPTHAPGRSSTRPGPRRPAVVVGVDMSEGSRHALEWAIEEALARHWVVQAVSIWTPTSSPSAETGSVERSASPKDVIEKDVGLALDQAIEAVAGKEPPVGIERLVLEGDDPCQTLCERSSGAELLVVGGRGRGGFAGLLLGSVASKCARHSPGPVVIVHPPGDRQGEHAAAGASEA